MEMTSSRRRRRAAAGKLAVAAGAVGVLLGGMEAGLRLWRGVHAGPTTNPTYVVLDEELGWSYRPGARVRHRTDEFDVEIAINARGFRDRDVEPEEGRTRVVALGDSFTFGWGVAEEECFAAGLEPLLDAQVFNLGVSGYGTDQQRLLLARERSRLRPDAVLVTLCGNDFEEVLADRMYGVQKPRYVLEGDGLVLQNSPVEHSFWERHLALGRFVARKLWEARRPAPDPERRRRGQELVTRLLAELAGELEEAGVPLVIASMNNPWLGRVAARQRNLTHVDLTPTFADPEPGNVLTFPRDGHWTARGHERVAEAVAGTLRDALSRSASR